MHTDEPDAPIACPCGQIDVQTITHVISRCPITAPLRHLLEDDDGEVDAGTLFADKLSNFLRWLKATHAFSRRFGEDLGAVSPVPGSRMEDIWKFYPLHMKFFVWD
ncbi:hypothetical protein BOTBODRAFT_180743 [Botryobasidium botryosum FD-172 SS1]|uniref:Uncharacterized protein n=1 Tax=Botryobasidium botryosum (strain FD-172 SS1) TaxID=930990 RepID=A0A067M6B7_BOTB1|nr:hypothetical protein BOTBODRAFT_180743 [Botryobasidium botryosum FD-172 SS1]